jgi:hypothetical protein
VESSLNTESKRFRLLKEIIMIQLDLFEDSPPENPADVSTFAKIFLDLFTNSFYSETFRESQRTDLIFFVKNCSDYQRGLYCEWVKYYSREWNLDIGRSNRDLLDRCIGSGGQYNYLI